MEVPAELYCDNKSVMKNSSVPVSVLNRTHKDICYNRVIGPQADGTFRVGWIPGDYNLVYLMTNTTMTGNMRQGLVAVDLYQ